MRWTEQEIDFLKKIYPDNSNKYCAEMLHRTARCVTQKANKIGLHKTPEFARQQREKNQFKKGHTPHNKGKAWKYYMSEEGQRNSAKTQFKGGVPDKKSSVYRPVGYESVRYSHGKLPYVYIKVAEDKRMVLKHRWVWEQAHGPIPEGYNVQFKDGNSQNCDLDNLYLIDRSVQVRKNFNDMSEERKAQTRAKIQEKRNESIKRDRLRLKWGLEPKTKLIKRRPL